MWRKSELSISCRGWKCQPPTTHEPIGSRVGRKGLTLNRTHKPYRPRTFSGPKNKLIGSYYVLLHMNRTCMGYTPLRPHALSV